MIEYIVLAFFITFVGGVIYYTNLSDAKSNNHVKTIR